jgi:dTDP-4-amino-4,6-dideoxygalactose transaminase
MQQLLDQGISSRRGIMLAHTEKAYTDLGYHTQLPVSEDLHDNSIILPLYVPMMQEDVDKIINTVLALVKQ